MSHLKIWLLYFFLARIRESKSVSAKYIPQVKYLLQMYFLYHPCTFNHAARKYCLEASFCCLNRPLLRDDEEIEHFQILIFAKYEFFNWINLKKILSLKLVLLNWRIWKMVWNQMKSINLISDTTHWTERRNRLWEVVSLRTSFKAHYWISN